MASVRNIAVLFALSFAAGCSKDPAPDTSAQSPTPATPLVTPEAATAPSPAADILTSTLPGATTSTTYQASFSGDQLERIEETREGAAPGAYEFRGARLLKYSGPATAGRARIEIELNLQGAVVRTHSSAGSVSAEEISAVRSRAQLLRSHALAQRAVHSHSTR